MNSKSLGISGTDEIHFVGQESGWKGLDAHRVLIWAGKVQAGTSGEAQEQCECTDTPSGPRVAEGIWDSRFRGISGSAKQGFEHI